MVFWKVGMYKSHNNFGWGLSPRKSCYQVKSTCPILPYSCFSNFSYFLSYSVWFIFCVTPSPFFSSFAFLHFFPHFSQPFVGRAETWSLIDSSSTDWNSSGPPASTSNSISLLSPSCSFRHSPTFSISLSPTSRSPHPRERTHQGRMSTILWISGFCLFQLDTVDSMKITSIYLLNDYYIFMALINVKNIRIFH